MPWKTNPNIITHFNCTLVTQSTSSHTRSRNPTPKTHHPYKFQSNSAKSTHTVQNNSRHTRDQLKHTNQRQSPAHTLQRVQHTHKTSQYQTADHSNHKRHRTAKKNICFISFITALSLVQQSNYKQLH